MCVFGSLFPLSECGEKNSPDLNGKTSSEKLLQKREGAANRGNQKPQNLGGGCFSVKPHHQIKPNRRWKRGGDCKTETNQKMTHCSPLFSEWLWFFTENKSQKKVVLVLFCREKKPKMCFFGFSPDGWGSAHPSPHHRPPRHAILSPSSRFGPPRYAMSGRPCQIFWSVFFCPNSQPKPTKLPKIWNLLDLKSHQKRQK